MVNLIRVGVTLCCAASLAVMPLRAAQEDTTGNADAVGSPLALPATFNAPFSADAVTTIKQTLRDGTRIDQTATARYYRDSGGRVRVEQVVPGQTGQNRSLVMLVPDPHSRAVSTLEPPTRTFYYHSRQVAAVAFNGRHTFALPLAASRFLIFHPQDWRTQGFERPVSYSSNGHALGSRVIGGIDAEGRRVVLTVSAGENGNAQPIDIVGEQWESPELKLLVYSRYSNPETGLLEYRLTNISRAEPSADLFIVPPDYILRTTSAADPAMGFEYWPRLERHRLRQ
jgi:hypothetical protein